MARLEEQALNQPMRTSRHVANGTTKVVAGQFATLVGLALIGAPAARAQNAAPITVTPPTLAPKFDGSIANAGIPEADGIAPPPGAENITLTLGAIVVSGGYSGMQDQTDAIIRGVIGQPVTLARVYSAASAIEARYAQAGYVLARVAVPPQELADGGTLRLLLIDGFFEQVDLAGVPARLRPAVAASVGRLRNRPHLRLTDIERALLIAGEAPGLSLRSTVARGTSPGGSRLILDGTFKPVTASVIAGNTYDPSLGSVGMQAQVSLNSLFGRGELIYGFVATGYDLSHLFDDQARVRVLGGGAIVRLGDGRLALNPEATVSRTRPDTAVGVPDTIGLLHRYSLRASYRMAKSRRMASGATLAIERIDVGNRATGFGVDLSHDRYLVARFGVNASWLRDQGGYTGLSVQFSQGLGDVGARTLADSAVSGVPFSRQGARTGFSTLAVEARTERAFGNGMAASMQIKGRTAFGRPTFRTEQFSLEGEDALSAYVGGVTAADEGVVGRAELTRRWPSEHDRALAIVPYGFVAIGWGRINRATAAEPGTFVATSFGLGTRAIAGSTGLTFSAEYAFGLSDYRRMNHADRINFTVGFRL
jgi:hemolysin activation/secretion protein